MAMLLVRHLPPTDRRWPLMGRPTPLVIPARPGPGRGGGGGPSGAGGPAGVAALGDVRLVHVVARAVERRAARRG